MELCLTRGNCGRKVVFKVSVNVVSEFADNLKSVNEVARLRFELQG